MELSCGSWVRVGVRWRFGVRSGSKCQNVVPNWSYVAEVGSEMRHGGLFPRKASAMGGWWVLGVSREFSRFFQEKHLLLEKMEKWRVSGDKVTRVASLVGGF